MILIDLHPNRHRRELQRARRGAMSPERRAEVNAMHAGYRTPVSLLSDDVAERIRERDRTRYAELSPERKAQKVAAAWRFKLKRYGITPERYAELVAIQGDRCACCGAGHPGRGLTAWCVDHDHDTDRVRGLLCHRCNMGIGLLGDTVDGVRNAVAYLERST